TSRRLGRRVHAPALSSRGLVLLTEVDEGRCPYQTGPRARFHQIWTHRDPCPRQLGCYLLSCPQAQKSRNVGNTNND
uniref:Uncharacterized protein n=1 Tax=Takifugu rubripes TaxID=31033 RepID=A0A674N0K9_TAKRU